MLCGRPKAGANNVLTALCPSLLVFATRQFEFSAEAMRRAEAGADMFMLQHVPLDLEIPLKLAITATAVASTCFLATVTASIFRENYSSW